METMEEGKEKGIKKHNYTSLFLLIFLLHHKISVVMPAALFQKHNNQFRMPGAVLMYLNRNQGWIPCCPQAQSEHFG